MNKKFAFHLLIFVSLMFVSSFLCGQKISLVTAVQAQTNAELNVSVEYWKTQRNKALEKRTTPTGLNPKGMVIPAELRGNDIAKQKAKLAEMIANGYEQPMDFADLADQLLNGELVEIPMATETYILDVGGNTTEDEFTSYDFENGSVVLKPDSPKYLILKKLADDLNGMKFDLNNPTDRKQIKIRLLRTINPRAKVALEEIAAAYFKQFKRPLRITSLNRSIEYQVQLNMTSPDTFLVRGKGSLPPHTSGCAFDIGRKNLTAQEQNFIMKKLAEMEQQDKMETVIEFGANACFHVFVFADGNPPKM